MRRNHRPTALPAFCALLLVFVLGGCAGGLGFGPAKLAPSRMDYNRAIQQSNNEEMLLNLVRMKYFEQPLFLQVGSVASSFSFNVSGGMSATLPDHRSMESGAYNIYTPNVSGQYSDSPTVTYTAFQGQTYAQQFLAEMDFDRFVTLYKAGWDIEYLMPILFVRFGAIDHTYDARTGFMAEQHARFKALTEIVARMDDRGDLDILKVNLSDNSTATVMSMDFHNATEAGTVQNLLGYDLHIKMNTAGHYHATFRLVPTSIIGHTLKDPDGLPAVPLRLRNCLRAMDYVAQGVEIPAENVKRRMAYDMRKHFMNLCDIRVSEKEPEDAYLSVRHEKHWYYIRAEDNVSKEVFQLIQNIFSLLSADPPKSTPVLTLPVGGG